MTTARHFLSRSVVLSTACLVFAVAQLISATGICFAQTLPANAKAAPAIAKAASATQKPAKHSSTKGTMIQVSGRWVIEVRNPDGKVTAHREFENAIQPSGMTYLAALLAGNNSPGQLSIMLDGGGSTFSSTVINGTPYGAVQLVPSAAGGPCSVEPDSFSFTTFQMYVSFTLTQSSGPYYVPCVISVPPNKSSYAPLLAAVCSAVPGFCSTNLTLTAPIITFSNFGDGLAASLTLSGSVVANAPVGGNITDVETIFETCSNATTTANCTDIYDTKNFAFKTGAWDAMNLLTMATLASPVPYTPGQTIAATVTFTFSSPSS